MDDGRTLDIGPDTVFDVPPGHDKWVLGDEPWETIEWGGSGRAVGAAIQDPGNNLATVRSPTSSTRPRSSGSSMTVPGIDNEAIGDHGVLSLAMRTSPRRSARSITGSPSRARVFASL
jgi:hypothetical protein